MIGTSYGNYDSLAMTQSRYQTSVQSRKSGGNDSFGTKVSNQGQYISVLPNREWATWETCPEVDKIPSKYALKEGGAISWRWDVPGIEYRFFHAAESTDENPVLVARGVDQYGKLFEEKINVRQLNPYNINKLELYALNDATNTWTDDPYAGLNGGEKENRGLYERFDFIAGAEKKRMFCNRLRLNEEASRWTKDIDFILSYTGNPARPDRTGNGFKLDTDAFADFAKASEKNLELYSSAARERLIYGMAQKCSEELSDMLWKK